MANRRRLHILSLLCQHGELTGAGVLKHDPTLPRGTIYTTLRRLEDDKLVTSRVDDNTGQPGPPRRFYKATRRGTRYQDMAAELESLIAG